MLIGPSAAHSADAIDPISFITLQSSSTRQAGNRSPFARYRAQAAAGGAQTIDAVLAIDGFLDTGRVLCMRLHRRLAGVMVNPSPASTSSKVILLLLFGHLRDRSIMTMVRPAAGVPFSREPRLRRSPAPNRRPAIFAIARIRRTSIHVASPIAARSVTSRSGGAQFSFNRDNLPGRCVAVFVELIVGEAARAGRGHVPLGIGVEAQELRQRRCSACFPILLPKLPGHRPG